MSQPDFSTFLSQHRLPEAYANIIENQIAPIAEAIVKQRRQLKRPLVVGVNGCQGSGKTTLSDALVMLFKDCYQLQAAAVSIDDFYLTKSERQQLGAEIHPLLVTRGVPGTHDTQLAQATLTKAIDGSADEVAIPRFDKAADDRSPTSAWDYLAAPLDIIILEGWCVGVPPADDSDLETPVNALEANEDDQALWRKYVNLQLTGAYRELFDNLDIMIMLKAPSFDTVYRWRLEQEDKLREARLGQGGDTSGLMSPEQIERFIAHYQRITELALSKLPSNCHFMLELDENRQMIANSRPLPLPTQ